MCVCVCVCVCVCKRWWMRVCATPATLLFLLACQLLPHDTGADKRRRNKHRVTNPDQARHPVPSVPRLPRKTTVDASLCHACHAPVPLGLSTTAPRHRCRQAQEKQTQGDKSGPSAPRSAICPTRGTLRGRRGTNSHPLTFHVAGVAQTRIHRLFAWQAWDTWLWVARLVRLGRL